MFNSATSKNRTRFANRGKQVVANLIEGLEARRLFTAIAADFNGGNGSTSVDQYPGIAGSGWGDGWSAPVSSGSFTSVAASSSNLLNGNGNRLGASFTASAASGNGSVSRGFASTGNVLRTGVHQVKFLYRADSPLTTFSATGDVVNLFGDTTARSGTSSTNTWVIFAYGAV